MKMRLRAGVAQRLVWSKPDSSIAPFCSVCQQHIPDDEVPMMMWNDAGACVQFCDGCASTSLTLEK